MLTVYVALVPYVEDASRYQGDAEDAIPFHQDLFHVCTALQTQVTRDFAPLWGVSAVVSPFMSLEHVPVGYIPIVIVPPGTLGGDTRIGFHVVNHTKPVALVEYGVGWSLLASHELLETIVDPLGSRAIRGLSVVDAKNLAPDPHKMPDYPDQGPVEYLVEVCDPCQWSTYTINGVLVSDFVTPDYYDPFQTAGARYSLTGRLDGPLKLLEGGYITWCVPETGSAWQAFGPESVGPEPSPADYAALSITELGVLPAFSREWVDSTVHPDRWTVERTIARGEPLTRAERAYVAAMNAAAHHGQRWREHLDPFVQRPSQVPVDDQLLGLLRKLATDDDVRAEYASRPERVVQRELGVRLPRGSVRRAGVPLAPKERYQAIADAHERGDRFQLQFDLQDIVLALGGLITH